MERLAGRLRARESFEKVVALARDLDPPRLELSGLAGELLPPGRQVLPLPLEVDEIRPVIGEPGEHRDGGMPLLLHRTLGSVDPLQGDGQVALEHPATGLVFRPGVGELAQVLVMAFLFAGEELEADAEQARFLLVLRPPLGDRLPLAAGEGLHIPLVLEEPQTLRGET